MVHLKGCNQVNNNMKKEFDSKPPIYNKAISEKQTKILR